MEFRILGPLEVVAEDRVIDLGGRRQRAVLAALVLRANEVVSVDLLVEDVWGAVPPPTAVKAVQGHVSMLRRQLGVERIRTTTGGYLLAVETGELDADRFATLIDEARSRNADGEREPALRALDEALALWRGPPLADLSYDDFAQAEIARLEELRLTALEERVDVELACGRHRQLVGDLERLVARHPLRERLRGQLMLALYRSGRQAEALEAYAAARRALVDELGIEPSRALHELEQAILQQQPALDWSAPADPEPAPAAPVAPARAETRAPRPHPLVLLAAGGALIAAAAATAVVVMGDSAKTPDELGNSIAAITPGRTAQVQYTPVGNTPSTIRVGEGAVWVLNADDRTISKVDPGSGRVLKTFGTGGIPTDLAVGEGAVWVGSGERTARRLFADINTTRILRVDPATGTVTQTIPLPGRASTLGAGSGANRVLGSSQIAVGAGAVWAVNPDHSVSRIDPSSGAVIKVRIRAGHAIAAGREGVWVIDPDEPELIHIDPRSNTAGRRIPVATDSLDNLAVGGGSLWATDVGQGLLWRIVPGARPTARTIETGFGSFSVSFAGGSAWVTNFISDEVVEVDAATNRIATRVRLAGTPPSVSATPGQAWISVAAAPRRETPPASVCTPAVAGGETPDVVIASSLALQGTLAASTRPLADIVRFVLQEHGFRAGPHRVGYQSCDDATGQSGVDDILKCASNAKAYAAASRLVGIVGPFTSPCAWAQLPITNRADGPLPMISPSNTHTGLTHRVPGADPGASGEPQGYYPTGVRHYFRVVSPSDYEGAAGAVFAHELGLRQVFVLQGVDDFSAEFAVPFERAARRLGLAVVGRAKWQPRAASYRAVAERIAAARPDAVFYAGGLNAEAVAGIRALRARIGRQTTLIASEAFTPVPDVLAEAGSTVVGMYVTSTASVPSGLSSAGRRLLKRFAATQPGGVLPSSFYVAEAAQAAEALLAAIARSDGTRSSVLHELRALTITDGVLGSIRFDRNGDITPARFTAYRITGERSPGVSPFFAGARVVKTVTVPRSLLGPAGGGE